MASCEVRSRAGRATACWCAAFYMLGGPTFEGAMPSAVAAPLKGFHTEVNQMVARGSWSGREAGWRAAQGLRTIVDDTSPHVKVFALVIGPLKKII